MEVVRHGVAAPPTKELDGVVVDAGFEESHGAPSPEGASTEFRGVHPSEWEEGGGGRFKEAGDIRSRDADEAEVVDVGGERAGGRRAAGAVVEEQPDGGQHGAAEGVVRAGMGEDFVANAILLPSKGVGDRGGRLEFSHRGGEGVEDPSAQVETDIGEEERLVMGGGPGVLAGSQEEEECHHDDIRKALARGGRGHGVGKMEEVEDDGNREGLDSHRGCVGEGVAAELAGKTEVDVAVGVETGVRGPHAGVFLRDGTDDVLHSARLDGSTAGGQATVAVALGKELEDKDGVRGADEVGVDVKGVTEGNPMLPGALVGSGALSRDPRSYGFLNKEHIRAEFITGRRWQRRQEVGWGKAVLK